LATDIGGDIDDTWALGLLLKSPELDLKLVVTDYGKPQYRGTLIAKFLQTTGHGDISIGLGPDVYADSVDAQAAWLGDYDLRSYKGTIHQDGAKALVDTLMTSPEAPTLISIGPTPTIAAALTLEPRIADRTRFVGMFGSIRVGYYGSQTPSAETNVKVAVKPAQQVLSAPWNITITPLDTCGLVTLEGDRYRRLLASKDPVVAAIIENYRLWTRSIPAEWSRALDPDKRMSEERSTVLYDTAAIYLAITQDLCTMERLDIRVTDDGFTRIDPSGKPMNVASAWKDLEAYKDFLVNRLLGNAPVRK
jgi:inosine-uridine nucleoside N-ribohydrolase